MKTASEIQVGGEHYKRLPIQPITFIQANNLDYCQGNVVKYVCRFRHKNGLDDLFKARHYIDFLIEQEMDNERSVEENTSPTSNP